MMDRRTFLKGIIATAFVATVTPLTVTSGLSENPDTMVSRTYLRPDKRAIMMYATIQYGNTWYDFANLYDVDTYNSDPVGVNRRFNEIAKAAFNRAKRMNYR